MNPNRPATSEAPEGEPSAGGGASSRRRATRRLAWIALGATLALLVAVLRDGSRQRNTLYLPAAKRVLSHNGAAAIKQTLEGSEVRWRKRNATITLDASLERLGPHTSEAVRQAFGTWLASDASLPDLAFDDAKGLRPSLAADGKNSVTVAPIVVPGHENDLAITITQVSESSGDIVEADIVINAKHSFRNLGREGEDGGRSEDEPRSSSGRDGQDRNEQRSRCSARNDDRGCREAVYDVQNVVTHEVGHFFGLDEDTEDAAATMYLCTDRCETHKRALTDDDRRVMAALYRTPLDDPDTGAAQAGCGGARLAKRGDTRWLELALVSGLLASARRVGRASGVRRSCRRPRTP